MKNFLYIAALMVMACSDVLAQEDNEGARKWKWSADMNLYIMEDDFYGLPVLRGDRGKLHTEVRYNYEDIKTVSLWAGINFTGGDAVEYTITPMAGVAGGNTWGAAPGLEMDFTWKSLELYTESECLFDFGNSYDSFIYVWSDLTISPRDWFWLGISGQRTRIYDTGLDIQRGIVAGAAAGNWSFSGYAYNPASDEQYFILALNYEF